MLRRNFDFFAIALIGVFMLGFSQAASVKVPDVIDTIHFQSAINEKTQACPIQREVLSRIAYLLNQ